MLPFQTELNFRRTVWEKNLLLLLRHNQEASAGKHSFTLGLNHLADMVGRGFGGGSRPSAFLRQKSSDLYEGGKPADLKTNKK